MYSLLNVSIEGFVTKKFGEDKWKKILTLSKITESQFMGNNIYNSNMTYSLVKAASSVLEVDGNDFLKLFGRYWILSVAPRGFGMFMDGGETSFEEFMINFPMFYSRVTAIFPDQEAGYFETIIGNKKISLLFGSQRSDLLSFIEGMVDGLATRFSVEVKTRYLGRNESRNGFEYELAVK